MFAFLKRTFVILFGFLLIVLFIWFAGPYFAFGTYRPLETVTARLIAIGIVIGCWLISKLVKRLRAFRASDRLMAAVVAQPQAADKSRPPADVQKLRDRFDEAVKALKQQRRGGHSLYDLPWYVIIGAPGSGKTTALLNSGLQFPLEQRVGKGALRGVGGTRNCDWWFTDEAIFLDTAGRYTTQDSDAASDSVGWSEFLTLLHKHRPRRPLNGVILTINAQDLIVQGAAARETHVESARNRLEELTRELKIQVPVYLMVTKCDLVDGFAEYFDDLTAEGRAQVWGVTFPYEQTLANEGPQVFPAEFDALITRLNERMFERVEGVRDPRRRAKVFAFPQQMGMLRESLTQFVNDVFYETRFDGAVLLRGVYCTSGTQEGTPIDRLLGSIGRRFGTSAAVMPSSGPGKAYFVRTLLKDVMIGESGLAGINRRLEAQKAGALLAMYAVMGLVAAAGVAVLSISYSRNRQFLDQMTKDITVLDQVPSPPRSASIERVVPRLDAIRGIVDATDRYRASTTWAMSWGLYQGAAIGNAAHDAYLRELESVLLPRVAGLLRSRMVQYSAEPEKLYLYLKGYLMLNEPKHLDKAYLQMLTDLEWQHGSAVGPALASHFQSLLDAKGDALPPLPIDGTLVGQARNSIHQTSMSRIMYDALKRRYADDAGQGLRIDQLAGVGAERLFRRKSGVPMSTPFPRLYSREVFKEISQQGRVELLAQLTKDNWVLGDGVAAATSNAGGLISGVMTLYEAEYTRAWDGLLADLQFVSFSTIPQANDALRILTSPTSPLLGILRVVGENTALVETKPVAAAPSGVIDETKKKFSDTLTGVLKPLQSAAGLPATEPGAIVTAHFQWVRQLTAGEPGKSQLDTIIATLSDIQRQLDALGPDVAGGDPVKILASPTFRVQMQQLQQQAGELPSIIRPLVEDIAEAPGRVVVHDATNEIEMLYESQVSQPCRAVITNRYPFADPTRADVQMVDFANVFGYDGLFDKFFTAKLENQIDTSQTPWVWRPGAVNPSRRLLEQFQSARRIRDMFFPAGSKTPEVKLGVTMTDLDPTATRFVIQIDGQLLDEAHQAPATKPAVWPGPSPGQVAVSFEGRFFDPMKAYGGPWALFRMIDATAEGPADAQQRIRLNVQNRYHRVRLMIEALRTGDNPFASKAWRQFSCES